MENTHAVQPRRRTRFLAVVTAALFSLVSVHIALADETIRAVEGPWTMSTIVITDDSTDTIVYYGRASTTSDTWNNDLRLLIYGYNNAPPIGWHQVDSADCYVDASTNCTSRNVLYNSDQSGASAAYAATEHSIWSPSGSSNFYDYYTSTDAAHSQNCYVFQPNCGQR